MRIYRKEFFCDDDCHEAWQVIQACNPDSRYQWGFGVDLGKGFGDIFQMTKIGFQLTKIDPSIHELPTKTTTIVGDTGAKAMGFPKEIEIELDHPIVIKDFKEFTEQFGEFNASEDRVDASVYGLQQALQSKPATVRRCADHGGKRVSKK